MAQYDVFVSYNSKDGKWAEHFASELKALGVRVWFDKWELKAGHTWLDGLATAIKESASVAVLIGKDGLGRWEEAELREALNKQVVEKSPVIPVILPDVIKLDLPPFLQQCHCIDYRDGQGYLERMEKLFLAITGRKLRYTISQVGEPFQLKGPGRKQLILVHALPNFDSATRLNLRWETFGQGISELQNQIRNYPYHLQTDLCVAINDSALAIAAFLSGSIMNRCKIGYIKTEGGPGWRQIIESDSWLPKLSQARLSASVKRHVPLILLVDSELKTGSDLKIVVQKLRDTYTNPQIYYAALGAKVKGQDPKIANFDGLRAGKILQGLKLSAIFIAYTFADPGIEPPLEIR
jgi:hypothetical protein